ncbi:(Fe-S)-binding protein [Planctomicrobium sp. SH668]|uniref:(Fe-S)-binding protein n=1 Tax=Planctomicrobium sp. SH668 TaxID=3448126 RepID=UPI003F5C5958
MSYTPELQQLSTPKNTASGATANIPYDRFLDCIHCGLCTAACPTYLETGDENNSPRGRIYLMRAVTDGRLEQTPAVSRHLDLCLDCRSCETACPSGVQYGRLIEPFRIAMHKPAAGEKEKFDWFRTFILYGLFPYAKRLRWALWPARIMQQLKLDRAMEAVGLNRLLPQKLQRMQRLLPKMKARGPELPGFLPAEGPKRATVALFTGCVADAMFPHVNWDTARVLQRNGCDVIIPTSQKCCGAIHYHSGAGEPAIETALANAKAFDIDQVDAVVINVAGCGAMIKDYGHMAEEICPEKKDVHDKLQALADKTQDVNEFLAKLGPVQPQTPVAKKVTYHDACHLCHAQKIRSEPRQLLSTIPGLEVVPLGESEICCGAAGSYNLTEPDMADRLGRRKVENILATGAEAVVCANAGCSLQIQAMLKAAGREDIPVVHPVELLEQSYRGKGK